jgi:hypothetical protein
MPRILFPDEGEAEIPGEDPGDQESMRASSFQQRNHEADTREAEKDGSELQINLV